MTTPGSHDLSVRERQVLEAVIQSYVETAEPAASRTLSRRFGLGVSPATIRNTMSDLEEKGYLFHPHTSAGYDGAVAPSWSRQSRNVSWRTTEAVSIRAR